MSTLQFSYGFFSVILVSLVSLTGAILLFKEQALFERTKNGLIALAVGALLGDAFIHLLPESLEEVGPLATVIVGFLGFLLFVMFERLLHWKHHHLPHEKRGALPVGKLNLISDAIHNFIDGVIVGAAYLISLPIGLTTTLAVILHEIPQELGDFAVLVKAGYTKKRALLFNFLSAAFAILGFFATAFTAGRLEDFTPWAVGFTAGGFVFIAYVMMRDLLRDKQSGSSSWKAIWLITGIAAMYVLIYLE